jgi:regulator of cell morphogenesis and NO signaling
MNFDSETKVADIAVGDPATIRIFQRHGIDFCCGGKLPLAEACASRGLDSNAVLVELRAAQVEEDENRPYPAIDGGLAELTRYIQHRYHEPLRRELPRLGAMLAKVVERHGERQPETFLPLQHTFDALQRDLIDHMAREDAVLFPLIIDLETMATEVPSRAWIRQIINRMAAEHEVAGASLRVMRELTSGYVPPDWACPTLIGLYHGLAMFERDMHLHVHLENAILFPGATGAEVSPIP